MEGARAAAATFSPPVELSALPIPAGRVHVVRDDLLTGGTKQRAAVPYLQELRGDGCREVVYASPFSGFAQVALASSTRHVGLACTLFCEEDRAQRGITGAPHAFSRFAESLGARLIVVATLDEAEQLAERYAATTPAAFKVPLGLDAPRFRAHLKLEMTRHWRLVLEKIGRPPRSLWLPVGSGTLANSVRDVLPAETELRCVNVRVLEPEDPRIAGLAARPGVQLRFAAEPFISVATAPPPLPSNAHYDAKLWRVITAEAQDGDVWWNVAR